MLTAKTLSDWVDTQADQNLFWLHIIHYHIFLATNNQMDIINTMIKKNVEKRCESGL